MNILIAGGSGMLGRVLVEACTRRGHFVYHPSHTRMRIEDPVSVREALATRQYNVIINCAGRVPRSGTIAEMIYANALGPHVLAEACADRSINLVHISTDCVFSGRNLDVSHRYSVDDLPDAYEPYGRSKMLGEPAGPHVSVIRTSFVGHGGGLLEWLKKSAHDRPGKSVDGWASAFWTGTSAPVLAEYIAGSLDQPFRQGVSHVVSPEKISKYHLLTMLRNILSFDIEITATHEPRVDRALRPTIELPPIEVALQRLRDE